MQNLKHSTEIIAYLDYLDTWFGQLPVGDLSEILVKPEKTILISVDVTEGFCSVGPLASDRVSRIVAPIVSLMEKSWTLGLRHILLSQDTHDPDAVEFGAYPSHCVRGSEEAQTISAIRALPFYEEMILVEKNSISTGLNRDFKQWMQKNPELETFIIVGDCTDLCVYQLALHLKVEANEAQNKRRVIVPADCVDTYHTSLEIAQKIGAFPHPGDLYHRLFLNHMASNGIEVTAGLK